jgi:hypothetical protein
MTNEQHLTATQIIQEYQELFYEKPIIVDMDDRKITLKRNGPVLHPHYKMLENGTILFGVGTEYTEYGMTVIGINSWKIINPNGAILDKLAYTNLELELTQRPVELSVFNYSEDLIRFINI